MDHVLITGFPKLLARRMALRLHAGPPPNTAS